MTRLEYFGNIRRANPFLQVRPMPSDAPPDVEVYVITSRITAFRVGPSRAGMEEPGLMPGIYARPTAAAELLAIEVGQ